MYKTSTEAADFLHRFVPMVSAVAERDVMIAPAFTALEAVATGIQGTPLALGAQDVFWETEGAYTGEVSTQMLAALGCRYVIIGHSERRQYFDETDETVNRKIRATLKAGLIPVMCIGETEKERDAGNTLSVLDNQLKNGLKSFDAKELGPLVIAYEPVWAIGTGKTATTDQAQEAHRFIRSQVAALFGDAVSAAVRILYGGSVKPENISELMAMADIDGALVGGASLNPNSFGRIVNFE
jgi:triosephosphate isomerase